MFLPTLTLTLAFSILKNLQGICQDSFLHSPTAAAPRSNKVAVQQHTATLQNNLAYVGNNTHSSQGDQCTTPHSQKFYLGIHSKFSWS